VALVHIHRVDQVAPYFTFVPARAAPDRSAIAGSFTFSARLQLGSVHGYSSGLSCLSCDLSSAALA